MNWSKSREHLIHNVNFKNLINNYYDYKKYNNIKKLYKNCCYCSGTYNSYVLINIDNKDDIACNFCYQVSNLNINTLDIILLYSTMSQEDVIKNTINYIIDNNKVPTPTDIDKNVKNINISKFEYVNILKNKNLFDDDLPFNFLNNIKIFLSCENNFNYINDKATFIKKQQFNINNLEIQEFTSQEMLYIKKIFKLN